MKKFIIASLLFLGALLLNAQTVTYPADLILADSVLENVHTKLTANSALNISGDGTEITVTGPNMRLTYDDLFDIQTNGGSVINYQLVFKAPVAFANESVHASLPNRLNAFSNVLTYENYFINGNVTVSGGFMYAITVNYAGVILTGSQIGQLANQARLLYGGSNSDYVLLLSDPEYLGL